MSNGNAASPENSDRAPRALFVYSADGLANRLLVLLSGRAIAGASGRAFGMDWQPASTCAAPFHRLFEGDWNVRPASGFDETQWRDLRVIARHRFPDLTSAPEPVLRVRYHETMVRSDLYAHHRPLERRMQEMWGSMRPVPEIQQRIDEFRQSHFRPVMIGVHLRRGDFYRARPELVNNQQAAFSAIDHWLTLAPDAGILLCTDDGAIEPTTGEPSPYQGVREAFRLRYGSRIVTPPLRSLDRAAPESIQDALQDLMLLRQTRFFVGTLGSTFSNLAAFGRDIPHRMVGGPTAAYEARQRRFKWTGLYYGLHLLGYLEFGAGATHHDLVRIYKWRFAQVRRRLKLK